MVEAYKLFWKNYVKFEGRTSRSEYWFATLWNVIISCAAFVLLMILGAIAGVSVGTSDGVTTPSAIILGIIILIYVAIILFSIVIFIPNLSMTIRRLRDAGYPWGFLFLSFIPVVGGIILLVFMCMPTKEVN